MALATRMLSTILPTSNAAAFFVPAERLPEKLAGVHVFRPAQPPARDAPPRQFDKSDGARYVWVHKGPQVSAWGRRGGRLGVLHCG